MFLFINILLSEPFFVALGNSIADELKKLHEEGQSIEGFSNFLLNDEKSHNYKAQAIYSGLKRCEEVNQIKEMLKMLQDAERSILLRFPGIGQAIRKLTFYIDRAATRTVSSHILNKSMAATFEDGVENEPFRNAISDAAAAAATAPACTTCSLFSAILRLCALISFDRSSDAILPYFPNIAAQRQYL